MTDRHNNHSPPAAQQQARRVLSGLLVVLLELDIKTFRQVTEAPDNVTDSEVLETMHQTRLEHPGVNQIQRAASRLWLQEHLL